MLRKVLIIRFSSFGDITQALSAISAIRSAHPNVEIHWICRSDFKEFLNSIEGIQNVWSLNSKSGFIGLIQLARELAKQKYTHIYDAHSNIRSFILTASLLIFGARFNFKKRSKNRLKRILLFKFRINLFPNPFRGQDSYLEPIKSWIPYTTQPNQTDHVYQIKLKVLPALDFKIQNQIILAPSANWELKRWPIEHWKKLILKMPNHQFILIGGPDDHFCNQIAETAPSRCLNLTGKLSWVQTAQVIENSKLLISGDTGVMHLADLLKKPTIALIGPTAFGYPSEATSKVLETPLYCRPCTKDGRGKCINKKFKSCLVDIAPESVAHLATKILL